MNRWTRRVGLLFALAMMYLWSGRSLGQAPATLPARPDEPVVLDFPADGVELKILADIVTRRLGIPIIYDESINGKKVIIRVPLKVPESALIGILQSALRMKQLALVDADQPGWKQIVPAQNLAGMAKPLAPGAQPEPGSAVTQVITLRRADPARVIEAIRPLLTQPGGNVIPITGQRMLVISDYGSVILRAEQVARLLDAEGSAVDIKFVPLKEADASNVANTVQQLLATRETFVSGNAAGSGVFITPDERLNQIVVLAPADRMKEVVELIAGMDRAQDLVTRVYRLKSIAPERIDQVMKNLLGSSAQRAYQASVDREAQALVVAATTAVHARLAELVRELDQPASGDTSPIRFYKLKNTKALDVLATIEGLTGERGLEAFNSPPDQNRQDHASPPPAARLSQPDRTSPGPQDPMQTASPRAGYVIDRRDRTSATMPANEPEATRSVRAANATVTADANTNSIIVIAPPAVQQLYAELVKRLDERRPQVQIECTIVTLDTTDGFSLGVDVAKMGGFGDNALITFSSFGVSTVDPQTGSLTPTQGRGGTFALLSPGIADIVIRALATNSRSRLLSAPQLLVNDNGKGQLKSVAQEPYAEIIDSNASQAITSFGGQAEAGTTIVVEPHISKDDYLQLTYSIELSNFTGLSSSGLPPPSQSNSVESTVTIPDGFTIVVGGLSTRNFRNSVESVPLLNQIPLLKYLFSRTSQSIADRTLFVFIRPIILRDDKFEDLRYLSHRSKDIVEVPGDYPSSDPIPLR